MDIKSASRKPPRHYPWDVFGSFENTIGVLSPGYGSGHVIYGLKCRRYVHRTLATATLKRFDKASTFFEFTPLVLDASVPLVHSFNSIPINKDFVVSFELELPRYLGSPTTEQIQRGVKMLASSRCKGLLALSDFACRYARRRLDRNGFAHLVDKMSVFRGAIADPFPNAAAAVSTEARPSFDERPLSAILIGSDLFRKGGMHAILAFEKLRASGLNVRLTLIGSFGSNCYAFREHIPNAEEWRARAESHDWIRIEGPIPNSRVFEELRAHDICLYPSLDESLGWLTIESGMLGVPVIGNRVCAYPELIQHRRSGWLIDLPVDEDGRWTGIYLRGAAHRAALADANEAIVRGIEDCIHHVYESPQVLGEWGAEARQTMTTMYGMKQASEELERIYDRALNREVLSPKRSP